MTTTTTTPPAARNNTPLLVGGGLALAGVGIAVGMVLRSPPAPSEAAMPQAVAAVAAPTNDVKPADKPVERTADRPVARKPRPVEDTRSSGSSRSTPLDTRPAVAAAPVCAHCGVVDSVRSFQQKGEGSGLGAVAGGVLGGALGNQAGSGNGKKAMTVIGAIGGGLAGHEIEKRAKSETLYEVRVRMDDGTLRTVTQKTAPSIGARVMVDGSTLRAIEGGAAGGDQPRLMNASART